MRDHAWLDFVRDRVLQEIAANPSIRPYLGETEPRTLLAACQRGHERLQPGPCHECRAAWKQQKRAEGKVTW